MNENLILAVPIFYPFAGALLAGIVGRKKEAARTYLANFIVVSEFLLVFALWTENGGERGGGFLSVLSAGCLRYGASFYDGGISGSLWADCGLHVDDGDDSFRRVYAAS